MPLICVAYERLVYDIGLALYLRWSYAGPEQDLRMFRISCNHFPPLKDRNLPRKGGTIWLCSISTVSDTVYHRHTLYNTLKTMWGR
jgi:hypothetical protein